MDRTQGIVYLVGAGPGDDKLITRRALDCLFTCDTVVYDYLASEQLLKQVRPDCERIYVGKKAGFHSVKQEEINRILVEQAQAGRCVVRLKGGDPMVFGRGGEEVLALQAAGIPYQVVPGVTSAVAALTSAGIPVTHRGVSRSFHVMTGHIMGEAGSVSAAGGRKPEGILPKDFEHFARLEGTLIFLMGLNNLQQIVEGLIRCGKPESTPAAVIENGTLPKQRVVRSDLRQLVGETGRMGIHSPAVIVVGEVAAYHMEATAQSPLYGVTVGLTGTEGFTRKLSAGLEAQGAQTEWLLPMEVVPSVDGCLEKVFHQLSNYTWLVLTSTNGVRLFFEKLLRSGQDYRALGHMKIAVIGRGTAEELLRYGFRADYVPEEFCSTALGQGLAVQLTEKDHVLIPRAAKGSRELTEILSGKGIAYEDVILYDIQYGSKRPDESDILEKQLNDCQYLVFGSGSGVDALFHTIGSKRFETLSPKVACIGDITAGRLADYGRRPDVVAEEFSVEGLIRAIIKDAGSGSTKI